MTQEFRDLKYDEMLLKRANSAVQKDPAIINKVLSRVRAIIGDGKTIEQNLKATAALEALRNGDVPSPSELEALELVIRLMRPAPMFKKGVLDPLTKEAASVFDDWPQFQTTIKPYLYSIGRIDRVTLTGSSTQVFETFGTGFVVSYERDLLVTNKHVLKDISSGSYRLEKGQAVVRFMREYMTAPDETPVNILGVEDVSANLDIALLKLEKTSFKDGRKILDFNLEPVAEESPVVAVGYPCYDGRNPIFINALFGEQFGVKRAAPGVVMELDEQYYYHDCSTLGGNSGSPVLSMKNAAFIGLHHEGKFTYRNEAIRANLVKDFLQPYLN